MPGQDAAPIRSEGGDRVLSFGPVRVHYAHLQSGLAATRGCRLCTEGLASFLASAPVVQKEPEVAKSDGGDEEGDTALPSGGWPDYR